MRLHDRYDGADDPFEGERTIVWRSLPEGAVVTKATITVEPRMPPGATLYAETLRFGAAGPAFGATLRQAGATVTEIDFHARRTAIGFSGIATSAANALSVDIGGGVFLSVGKDGTIPATPPGSVFPFTGGLLPGLGALRLRLDTATLPADLATVTIGIATMPSNLTLRFGKQSPFFARNGDLGQPATTPDITAAVQRALTDSPVSAGFHTVSLVVHSDTLGRLAITIDVDYLGTAPLLPAGLREVVLPYGFASVADSDPAALSARLPAGAAIVAPQTALQLRGAFDASRVAYGPTGTTIEGASTACSASQTLAQPLTPDADITVTGLDLFVAADGPAARLAVDIRTDSDGKPGQASLLPKAVPFDLQGDATGQRRWTNVPITPAALLVAGKPIWIVVQALDGSASLGAATAPASGLIQRSSDAGFSWRHAGLAAPLLLRLRHVPGRFAMPIDFVAGAGPAARRVALSAYDALGKIDAVIDRPEIAAAIQAALAATVPAPCTALQLLANPDFAQWMAVGAGLGPATTIALGSEDWADLIDSFFDRIVATPYVDLGPPTAFAFGNDGATLYALADGKVTGFDTSRFEAFPLASVPDAVALAAAPRGGRLYAAGGSNLTAIDLATGATEGIDRSFSGAQALLLAPDGGTAFLADRSTIVAHDLLTGLIRWRAAFTAIAIALSADGATLVAADAQQPRLATFAAASGQPGWTMRLPDGRLPLGVGAAARGGGFYAVGAGATASGIVDLALIAVTATGRAGQSVTLPIAPATGRLNLLVKPQGDRVYIAPLAMALDPAGARLVAGGGISGAGVIAVPVGARRPSGWSLTAGRTDPVEAGDTPPRIEAALAPDGGTDGALSQVVAVSPGCSHELAVTARLIGGYGFRAMANGSARLPEAAADLFWLDASGALLRADTLALPPSRLAVTQSLRVTPPATSAQAEIRLRVASGVCVLRGVTLRMTDAALRDDAWQRDPTAASPAVASDDADGVLYSNPGIGMAALTQQVALETTGAWVLDLQASARANPAGEVPGVEIQYLDALGAGLGGAQAFPVTAPAFAAAPALLNVPIAAAGAQVRLTLPAGASLRVRRLQLRPRPMAVLPCGFIAQSPGTLHVSNARIVYDLAPATAPGLPAMGLSSPTPPGSSPGDPACAVESGADMAATVFPSVLPAPARQASPRLAEKPAAAGRATMPAPIAAVPLTDIDGIGTARAQRLQTAGIATLRDLAAASPARVLVALGGAVGVTPALVAALIARAKDRLATADGP